MNIITDILVVGAGPAGSMAARYAADEGADVILIEKKSEIGSPKRCAEGIYIAGLEDVGIKIDQRWVAREVPDVRLVSPDGTSVWFNDEIELIESGYVVERKVFDKHMAMDASRAGAKIMIKTRATGLKRENDRIIVSAEQMGEKITITAKIVIAADGPEGHIARWAGLDCSTPFDEMLSCAQFEMTGLEMENSRAIQMYFGSVAPGGYAWIFPKGEDTANVGLGVLKKRAQKSAYEYLLDFVKKCSETQKAQAVELNVGGIPVGGIIEKRAGDNILVAGDAAGFANPITGGGINSALESGMYAGQVAAKAVKEGNFTADYLKEYVRITDEIYGEEFKMYMEAKEYLLSLDDEEFDKIAHGLNEAEIEEFNHEALIKNFI